MNPTQPPHRVNTHGGKDPSPSCNALRRSVAVGGLGRRRRSREGPGQTGTTSMLAVSGRRRLHPAGRASPGSHGGAQRWAQTTITCPTMRHPQWCQCLASVTRGKALANRTNCGHLQLTPPPKTKPPEYRLWVLNDKLWQRKQGINHQKHREMTNPEVRNGLGASQITIEVNF